MFVCLRLAAAVVALSSAAAAQTPPNVILVIGDDMGIDLVNAYHAVTVPVHTPVIDGLAADGVLFHTVWAYPGCTPTRASMMLGKQPFRHGMGRPVNNLTDSLALDEGDRTLAHVIAPVATPLALGKWHMNLELDQPLLHPLRSGFVHYLGNEQVLSPAGGETYYYFHKDSDGVLATTTTYSTTDIVDDALQLIASTPQPWFLWLAFNAPHAPFHKPPPELHTYTLPPLVSDDIPLHVKAAVEAMDTELGRLLDTMDPVVRANTLVIFIGDNGTDKPATVAPFDPAHAKATLYEGGVHVPLIVSGPGVAKGAECDALVQSTDLFATIAEAFGVAQDSGQDSVSLWPYFADPALPSLRDHLYSENFEPPGFGPHTHYDRAVRDARFKLLHLVNTGVDAFEFYDLDADPFEHSNLLLAPLAPDAQAAYDTLSALLLPAPATWNEAGYGVYGVDGVPRLSGTGSLLPGSELNISLGSAAPLAPVTLFVGVDWLAAHFKAGVLGPTPDIPLGGLVTDNEGGLMLQGHWPEGLPSGFTLYAQAWLADPAAAKGVAASNDLILTTP